MSTDVECTCDTCGIVFMKRRGEFNRQVREGAEKFYCTCRCSILASNQVKHDNAKGRAPQVYAVRKKENPERFCLMQITGRIRGRAKTLGIKCLLGTHDLYKLWCDQNGECYYSKLPMTLGKSTREEMDPDQVSVDRIIPEDGYVPGNIVLCCYWINSAKMRMSLSSFQRRVLSLAESIKTCELRAPR